MPAPAMTTIFWRLCSALSTRSRCSRSSSEISLGRRSSQCVERSLGSFETFRLFAGGGPSTPDSAPSGVGEPFTEVFCDAGGEGYGGITTCAACLRPMLAYNSPVSLSK